MAGEVDSSSVWRAHRATSSMISVLYAWKSPACGGVEARALDCIFLYVARILSAYFMACTSNFRFSRAVEVKGQQCKFSTHN
jgi:hypothetical protein